jgi:tRNA pseudouridine13 synthase
MRAHAMPDLPAAVLRASPEDFVVEELPLYPPSGRGEHLYLTFRKRGRTTLDVVRALAAALDVDPRAVGYAGLKDRHAVTTQTASFPFPIARDPAPSVAALALPDVDVLSFARHDNKLKPGHLAGNRFHLVLRDLDPAGVADLERSLHALATQGVPNAFGPQRFGRDGANPDRALAWLAGRDRGPRDRTEQRLLVSALQSLLFNRVLARREAAGTWSRVLPGDLAKRTDSGGMFLVPLDGPDCADALARAEAGLLRPTGPMFGFKMRRPEGEPDAIEQAVLTDAMGESPDLARFRHAGEGTRRPLVLPVSDLLVDRLSDPAPGAEGRAALSVRFVLPKGGYATTVLGRVCVLKDRGPASPPPEPHLDDA